MVATAARRLAVALAVILLAGSTAWAGPATGDKRIEAAFEVYWLGFRVFSGTLTGAVAGDRYRMTSASETRGVLDLFASAVLRSRAEGRVNGAGLEPTSYVSRSIWDGNERAVDLAWRADGGVEVSVRPPPGTSDWDADRGDVPEALRRGTHDPLTALLQAVTVPLGAAPCDRSFPVFDGRRRYNLRLEAAGEDTLAPGQVAVYAGPVVKCLAHFEKVAGFAKKWAEDNPQPDEPATVWLAPFQDAGMWLPVKASGKSFWGTIEAALIETRIGSDGDTADALAEEARGETSD